MARVNIEHLRPIIEQIKEFKAHRTNDGTTRVELPSIDIIYEFIGANNFEYPWIATNAPLKSFLNSLRERERQQANKERRKARMVFDLEDSHVGMALILMAHIESRTVDDLINKEPLNPSWKQPDDIYHHFCHAKDK